MFDLQLCWYVWAESFLILNIISWHLLRWGKYELMVLKVGGVPTQRIQMWTGFLLGLGPEWTESLRFWPPTIRDKGHQPRHSSRCRKKYHQQLGGPASPQNDSLASPWMTGHSPREAWFAHWFLHAWNARGFFRGIYTRLSYDFWRNWSCPNWDSQGNLLWKAHEEWQCQSSASRRHQGLQRAVQIGHLQALSSAGSD